MEWQNVVTFGIYKTITYSKDIASKKEILQKRRKTRNKKKKTDNQYEYINSIK